MISIRFTRFESTCELASARRLHVCLGLVLLSGCTVWKSDALPLPLRHNVMISRSKIVFVILSVNLKNHKKPKTTKYQKKTFHLPFDSWGVFLSWFCTDGKEREIGVWPEFEKKKPPRDYPFQNPTTKRGIFLFLEHLDFDVLPEKQIFFFFFIRVHDVEASWT